MKNVDQYEQSIVAFLRRWSLPLLRISLGIVYVWFGALKIAEASPVLGLIRNLYPSYPEPMLCTLIGFWEVLIGLGFLSGKFLRTTIVLMLVQMGGVMSGLVMRPDLFFQNSNPLLLTYDGEFLIKNLVLISASLVVAGYCLKPRALRGAEAVPGVK